MDVFPTIMDYMGVEVDPEWELEGPSRIEWQVTDQETCTLERTRPAILLSGSYLFEAADAQAVH